MDRSWRDDLHDYMGGVINGLGGQTLGIGAIADHVHLLVSLKTNHPISDIVRELKKASGQWIKENHNIGDFHWQEGYGAFTVSSSATKAVQDYINNQEEHHRHKTFAEEFREFLDKSEIPYDPKYLP